MQDVLERPLPPLTTHGIMEEHLKVIADHLLEHFSHYLIPLYESNRFEVAREENDEAEAAMQACCELWDAEVARSGICKAFVFVNHQWVVKIGKNACDEWAVYANAEDAERELLIPTARLGTFGCLQVKAMDVFDYVSEAHPGQFDAFWLEPKLQERRTVMSLNNDDLHMENIGVVNGRIYCLDFGGADPLFGRNVYNDTDCTCHYCRPDLYREETPLESAGGYFSGFTTSV